MSKIANNRDLGCTHDRCVAAIASNGPGAQEHALQMRRVLSDFIARAANGSLRVVSPPATAHWASRGAGHMHLHAELFLQVSGLTEFRFPHGRTRVRAGEALLVPPKLLHDESASTDDQMAFSNVVVSASGQGVSCHLAHEDPPGQPASLYLEFCQHFDASRIEGWLGDAAKPPEHDAHGLWALQQRALILSALSGLSRVLDAPQRTLSNEHALLARLRVMTQNRLGETDLTIARLAKALGYSGDYISHLYSRGTGEHLWQAIIRQRLARAARLLADTDSAVKEIAWCCGFASASYFIRTFKRQFGVTPKTYRLQVRPAVAPIRSPT